MGTPQAAYAGTVSVSGAAAVLTNAATTKLTANTRYQVTAAANRRLDPATAVVVEVDADGAGAGGYVVAAHDTYTVDYLFGIVTFLADQGSSATVRISGKYLPVVPVAFVREVSLSFSNDMQDVTALGSSGFKARKATLGDFSGDLGGVDVAVTDLDAGAGVVTLQSLFDSGAPFLLEVTKGSGAPDFRGWVKLPELGHKLTAGDVYSVSLKFVGHSFQGAGQTEYVAWGYGS